MQKIYRDICGLFIAVIRREARQVMESFVPNATKLNRVYTQHERRLQALESFVEKEKGAPPKRRRGFRITGDTLKRIRKRLKINQRVLALLLEANHVTVNRWERGKDKPGLKAKAKIARIRDMKTKDAEALVKEKTRRPSRFIKID